jgi:long-chain acyl-CoA synthetase
MFDLPPGIDYLAEFARHGSSKAYVCRRDYRITRLSYGEVAAAAAQFSHELQSRGIGKGSRVLIWGENLAEWVIAFLGCMQSGVVAAPVDSFATPDFVSKVIRDTSPSLVVSSRGLAEQLPKVLPPPGSFCPSQLSPAGRLGQFAKSRSGALKLEVIEFDRLREVIAHHPTAPLPAPNFSPEDPAEVIFTSGTTSEPRGVVLTHANIQASLAPFKPEISKYLKYERFFHPIRFLNLVPLSHVFGQFMGIFIPPLLGAEVHFSDSLSASKIFATTRRDRISVLVAVPRIVEALRSWLEHDIEAAGLSPEFKQRFTAAAPEAFLRRWWRFRRLHWKLGWKFWALVCGGAALDAGDEMFWRRLGFVVAQGYGLTETASLISVNHPFDSHAGSIGKLLPGLEIKLSERGEIWVRGKNIAAAYWRGDQLEPVLDKDGWFHTGDMGEIDSSGRLYFKGRSKRVIVTTEGMNVFPEDLEAALRRQPEIKDCVVAGIEVEGNAVPFAALILSDDRASPATAVRRANAMLASYQQIRHWILWPGADFPRTPTLKPRLAEIEEYIRGQVGLRAPQSLPGCENVDQSAQAVRSPSALNPKLIELVEQVTRRKIAASPESLPVEDLNLSSIERVELLSLVEDRYGMGLDDGDFTAAATLGDLAYVLQAKGARFTLSGSISQPEAAASATPSRVFRFTFPSWALRWPFRVLRVSLYYFLIWPATMLLGKPRIIGREHLRGLKGPVLVISNHVFMTDPGYVLAALPWRFRHRLAVAMDGELIESLHHPPHGTGLLKRIAAKAKYFLITLIFNVFPLPQKASFRSSFVYAGECVDRGYSLLIFPEGERTKTGQMGPFRSGIGILASSLRIPIVPVRLLGLYEQKGRRIVRPHAIRVKIGPVLTFSAGITPEAITQELERRMATLANSPR